MYKSHHICMRLASVVLLFGVSLGLTSNAEILDCLHPWSKSVLLSDKENVLYMGFVSSQSVSIAVCPKAIYLCSVEENGGLVKVYQSENEIVPGSIDLSEDGIAIGETKGPVERDFASEEVVFIRIPDLLSGEPLTTRRISFPITGLSIAPESKELLLVSKGATTGVIVHGDKIVTLYDKSLFLWNYEGNVLSKLPVETPDVPVTIQWVKNRTILYSRIHDLGIEYGLLRLGTHTQFNPLFLGKVTDSPVISHDGAKVGRDKHEGNKNFANWTLDVYSTDSGELLSTYDLLRKLRINGVVPQKGRVLGLAESGIYCAVEETDYTKVYFLPFGDDDIYAVAQNYDKDAYVKLSIALQTVAFKNSAGTLKLVNFTLAK